MESPICVFKQHGKIHGVVHNSVEHKMVLFADKIFIFIFKLYSTSPLLMQKIDAFSRKAALSKLELMPIDGNLVSHPFKKLSIICICTESIK